MKHFLSLLLVLMALTASATAQCPAGATVLAFNTPTTVTFAPTATRCYPATYTNEIALVIDGSTAPSEFFDHHINITGGTLNLLRIVALNEDCDTILRAGFGTGNPDLDLVFHYDGDMNLVIESPSTQIVTVTWTQAPVTPFTYYPCSYLTSIDTPQEQPERSSWRVLNLDGTLGKPATPPFASGSFYFDGQRRIYVQ
jgi:hypothetical protein